MNILSIMINKCSKITQINPNEVVIDKIIRGDKGDNIFPIILKKSNNKDSQKLFRVSQKDIDFNLNINDDGNIKNYLHNIMSSKKYYNKMINNNETNVFDHFKYNYKLVVLDEKNYPQPILEEMNSYMDYNVNNNVSNILQYLNARNEGGKKVQKMFGHECYCEFREDWSDFDLSLNGKGSDSKGGDDNE